MQYRSCFVEFVITNTAVQMDSKIGAGRESNSHSKFVVSSKYVHIIADVILKAAHANTGRGRRRPCIHAGDDDVKHSRTQKILDC